MHRYDVRVFQAGSHQCGALLGAPRVNQVGPDLSKSAVDHQSVEPEERGGAQAAYSLEAMEGYAVPHKSEVMWELFP